MNNCFLVRAQERANADAQEEAAMLRIRAKAIDHRQTLLQQRKLTYAFYLKNAPVGLMLVQTDRNTELDALVKADPLFPYCHVSVTPVIDTEWLIREAQAYLKEEIISVERAAQLVHPLRPANDDHNYLYVTKEVRPFSPLLPEVAQDEIFRKTVRSQDAHENHELEFADHNPVGQQIGILIGCGTEDEVMTHVRHC
jgi:muconolactone delta-isomerase